MLIEFTVGNHLSFKQKKTLSLEASSIKEFEENVFLSGHYRLLKSVVIYGANSSGKSNLLKSLSTMQDIVKDSSKMSSTDKIAVQPFLLNIETEKQPSFFEVLILIDNIRYRYGFEVDENIVHSEWLFKATKKNEIPLFFRDKSDIEITKEFPEGNGIEERTRDNALFLTAVDQWNGKISKKIMGWFHSGIFIISGLHHEIIRMPTVKRLNEFTFFNKDINDFTTELNLGFHELKVDPSNQNTILTQHKKYDGKGNVIGNHWFNLIKQESSGTNKIFDLAAVILAGLKIGHTTIIDELDAKLHPLLTIAIVKLFNSVRHNPYNAQLIFATHDTNLLSCGCFRRDQIYFTEKNQYEETDLYSLVEYIDTDGKKVRNDNSFEKDYINGRYGAIPFIGEFSNLLADGSNIEN